MSNPDTDTESETQDQTHSININTGPWMSLFAILVGIGLITAAVVAPAAAAPIDSDTGASAGPSTSNARTELCDSSIGSLLGTVNALLLMLGLMLAFTSYNLQTVKSMLGGGTESKKRAKQAKTGITREAATLVALPSIWGLLSGMTGLPGLSCVIPTIL